MTARQRMFVTGGSGFLGRHLVPIARATGWDVTAPRSADVDIRDGAALVRAVSEARPDAVVHLAVRSADEETIVEGTGNVARAAVAVGARLVHMSTDVVFHGRPEPYTESDRPDPLSAYGHLKRAAELAVEQTVPDAAIVRTSVLYGTEDLGRCQHDVVRALDEPDEGFAFFTDELRCFTHVDDVATALVYLAAHTQVDGPLHVSARGALSRYAFARSTADWLGRSPERLRETTLAEGGLERPAAVMLDPSRSVAMGLACRPLDAALAAASPPDVA